MYQYKITNKNNRELGGLFIFIEESLKEIIEKIPFKDEIGYAGYKSKKWLKNTLNNFGVDGKNTEFLNKNKNEIKKIVEESLNKCEDFFDDVIYIFIFPSSDNFIKEKMGGVNGFTPWKKTILIFINPIENWKESLKNIIIHEIVHTITRYYGANSYTLGESFIHEGIAENFKEDLLKKRASWTEAINKKESIRIFREIRQLLNKENDYKMHNELFFGIGKYPNWTGYTIGYYLVKEYLSKKFRDDRINWKGVFKIKPQEILNNWL